MRLNICLTLASVLMTAALAAAQGEPPAKDPKAKTDQRPLDEKADAKAALEKLLAEQKKENEKK